MSSLRELPTHRFHLLAQKLLADSAKNGLLKSGAMSSPINVLASFVGPSYRHPMQAYMLMTADSINT